LYHEFFHEENDQRKQSNHKTKIKELMKMRAFELKRITFEDTSNFFGSIQKAERNLGAKLFDYALTTRMDRAVSYSNRMRIEVQVLQEYYEEMKIELRREDENKMYKSKKIERKREDMP
jgi:hypothetical protein